MAKTGTFKVAKQGSKGTAATSGFHCGLYTSTDLHDMAELLADTAEHGCSSASTVFRDLSQQQRTFYRVEGGADGFLYPNVLGALLIGLGFSDSVSGTTAKTHVLTAAAAASDPWLSIIRDAGVDTGSTVEVKAKDCRTTQIKIDADGNGVRWSSQISGLSMAASAGTETSTTEPTYKMQRSLGAFTLTFDPDGTPVTISSDSSAPPRAMSVTLDNPIRTDSYALWSAALDDLPRGEGLRISGEFSGLPVQYSVYKQLNWGGASGTAPSTTWLPCEIDFTFETAEEITTGVPYSLQFTIPHVKAYVDPASFRRTGKDDGRMTVKWTAYAGSATPITATLINTVATY